MNSSFIDFLPDIESFTLQEYLGTEIPQELTGKHISRILEPSFLDQFTGN